MNTTEKRQSNDPRANNGVKFSKDRQPPNENKRVPKKKTRLKKALGIENIDDLIPQVLKNWEYLSKLKSKSDKKFVNKEISPYLFTKKQQTDLNVKGEIKLIINGIEKL